MDKGGHDEHEKKKKQVRHDQSNTEMKRCVFSRDLKQVTVGAEVIVSGSLLYSVGARTEKARPPYDWVLWRGTTSDSLLDERRLRRGA